MRKLLLVLCLSSSYVFADVPHITPALVCPQGEICCPQSVTCSFIDGCGNSGQWQINGSVINYQGLKTFNFTNALLTSYNTQNNGYGIAQCQYNIQNVGYITLSVQSNNQMFKVQGNEWQFSFERKNAQCKDINSSSCEFYDGYSK